MKNIIKKYELIFVEASTNNNKVWRGLLYDDGTGASEFGRVGYDVQTCEYPSHSIVESKMRGKLKKGYTELKIVSNTTSGLSTNIKNGDLNTIARSQLIKAQNPILSKLIDRLVAANVHKITTNTQITYNSSTGLFATPLGIVTMDGIVEARNILADITPFIMIKKYNSALNALVSRYLRIIPQNVGMRLDVRSILPDDASVEKQSDLIDSLESSYQALQTAPSKTQDNGTKSLEQVFKVDMDVLNDTSARTRLENWFERSKQAMHSYNRIKVREIFSVTIRDMKNAFDNKIGNNEEVWHGTSQANCLSILKSGLKTAPPSTASVAGKMFGNGIYGAKASSKSLGYTYGKWGQGGGDSGWLFVCDFAMGSTRTVYDSCNKPSGYDSVWAKAGRGLKNDELIVYRNNQCNIKYLLECK